MRTIEEKLASLNATSVWYFAKQDTNFDNAFKAVQIVHELGERWSNEGTNAWQQLAPGKQLESNHRILSVAQILGLLTKKTPFGKSGYNNETPTPVFYELNKHGIGHPEYNALKTEQLLKLRMNAITDTRADNRDYNISPVLFVYEVFWRLKQLGITEIPLDVFYTYVMTCKTHDELDECISFLTAPDSKVSEHVASYKNGSRVANLIQNNLNLIKFSSTSVAINPSFEPYFNYFFNGAYTSFVNMMKFVVKNLETYQQVLTNPIGLSVNFLDDKPQAMPQTERTNLDTRLPDIAPLQQIFYGAPGTGKSNIIKREVDQKGLPRVRTTFHPDSDYSTFVGAYKPTSVEGPTMTVTGTKAIPVENPDGSPRVEKKIVYEFVPQAFLKAYAGAWKNQEKPFYLIIEEINRGNCAQIFGDLFQLLDRNEKGESDYPISPDEDIQKFLRTNKKYGFAALTDAQKAAIPDDVLSGKLMTLPKNLHIWATMNTSDQSLFPIDSAFKRRWDWQYMPISDGKKGWRIAANGKQYDWWQFLQKMNEQIGTATNSEDKKLGYYFCKATDGIIDAATFVGKVVFYVWNDVFKDFAEEAGDLFKDSDDTLLSFNKFYTADEDGRAKIAEEKVERILTNLKLKPVNE